MELVEDYIRRGEHDMLLSYRRMVFFIANRIARQFHNTVEREDIEQEVQLAFVEAAKTYRPEWSIPFGLYARTAGKRRGYDFCRRQVIWRGIKASRSDLRNGIAPRIISIDKTNSEGLMLADDIPERMQRDNESDQDEFWNTRFEELTERQKTVLAMTYRDGLSQNEIAARLGIFQASVWTTIKSGLKAMKKPAANRNQMEKRRAAVTDLIRREGPQRAKDIAVKLGIPKGTVTFVLRCDSFRRIGESSRSPFALSEAL